MIYLDNAATKKMYSEVLEEMLPYMQEIYANPSSIYRIANHAKAALREQQDRVAGLIHAQNTREIYFTSGGTESDNWALKAVFEAYGHKGKHIITQKTEHHAVIHTCRYLESLGAEVTYLNVNEYGEVDLNQLKKAIREDTILISIMYANNEIGTLLPIKEIGKIAKEKGILFHTDAVQALGAVKIDVQDENIDLLSGSAHKLGGPKGVGFLYIKNGVKIHSLIHGGAQERERRAGTENISGIVGLGAAAHHAAQAFEEVNTRTKELRDYLWERIVQTIPDVSINGHPENRLPNNLNVQITGTDSEAVLIMLDMKNICVSGGSACTSGSLDASHVLAALGQTPEQAKAAVRFTLSEENTKEELDETVECLKEIVKKIRRL